MLYMDALTPPRNPYPTHHPGMLYTKSLTFIILLPLPFFLLYKSCASVLSCQAQTKGRYTKFSSSTLPFYHRVVVELGLHCETPIPHSPR